jgi:hypothetical protein
VSGLGPKDSTLPSSIEARDDPQHDHRTLCHVRGGLLIQHTPFADEIRAGQVSGTRIRSAPTRVPSNSMRAPRPVA